MEWWATVAIVVLSNIVIGVVSLLTARMQINHSHQQWLRELRSGPLLALRSELSFVAAKCENAYAALALIFNSQVPLNRSSQGVEEAAKDLAEYGRTGDWTRILFTIHDADMKNMADKIIVTYLATWSTLLASVQSSLKSSEPMDAEVRNNVATVLSDNRNRVEEAQQLIDKKLREL